jgi:nucleotide-binding universal stress UspA family protein
MAVSTNRDDPSRDGREGGEMQGTVLCAVTGAEEGEDAVAVGAELSERLGLRLVLAHALDGMAALGSDGNESVTMKQTRQGAERRLRELADRYGVAGTAERRLAVGDPAAIFGRIAAEESADVILVCARLRGWRRRSLESRLADELETETPVPMLLAPPRKRRAGKEPGRADRHANVAV